MTEFRRTIRAGGVIAAISSRPPQQVIDDELQYQEAAALMQICRELKKAGYLTISPIEHDGDYQKREIVLRLGGEVG